jgi:hypothetical protein
MAKGKAPIGRPSKYTDELASEICATIAESDRGIDDLCAERDDFPGARTVRTWIVEKEDFRQMYARAKELQADFVAHQTLPLADNCRIGEKTEKKEIGRVCSACNNPVEWRKDWKHADKSDMCEGATAQRVYEEKISTGDMVERTRLQIDARKWLAAKLSPRKYGDKLELAGDPTSPLVVEVVRFGKNTTAQ